MPSRTHLPATAPSSWPGALFRLCAALLAAGGLVWAGAVMWAGPAHAQPRTYVGELVAFNDSGVSGVVRLVVDEEENVLGVRVQARGLDDVIHPQHIHVGSVCPGPEADANDDGYVDVLEGAVGERAIGGGGGYGGGGGGVVSDGRLEIEDDDASVFGILLPLDGDIGSQEVSFETFPRGREIDYRQRTRLGGLMRGLRAPDRNPKDAVVTLGEEGEFEPAAYTVVVHGTAGDVPRSVFTPEGYDPQATLPVACAEFERE